MQLVALGYVEPYVVRESYEEDQHKITRNIRVICVWEKKTRDRETEQQSWLHGSPARTLEMTMSDSNVKMLDMVAPALQIQ